MAEKNGSKSWHNKAIIPWKATPWKKCVTPTNKGKEKKEIKKKT